MQTETDPGRSDPPWPRRDDRPDRRVERLAETHHRRLHEFACRADDDCDKEDGPTA